MTRGIFPLRTLALYLAVAAALVVMVAVHGGRPIGQGIAEATLLLPCAAIGFGLLLAIGRMTARASTYTLTNRRLILHIGIAYEMTVSVPLSAITGAALRRGADGCGDIALTVKDRGGTGFIALWPHVRPWRLLSPQPMLRCVPDAEAACETIGDALTLFNAGGRRAAAPRPAPASASREAAAA